MKKKVTLYVKEKLVEEAKKLKINLSSFLEYHLENYLKSIGIEIKEPEHKLVVLVRCPRGHEISVVLIDAFGNYRSDRAYCKYCRRQFRIRRRILTILKGDKNLYMDWYSKKFNTSFLV